MRSKSNNITIKEELPSIIKRKIERYKTEGRLFNKKEIMLENYLSIMLHGNVTKKKIMVILEILNYTELDVKPVIPRYGKLISEIFRINIIDPKGITIPKEGDISYVIKASDLTPHCYPLLFYNGSWKIAERFSIESDGISISDREWNIVVLVKEPPNDIITITPNGGMTYSEMDKITNLRIPKGIFKENKTCKIQFVEILEDKLNDFRLVYEDKLAPFSQLSPIFIIQPIDNNRDLVYDEQHFRRPITIKIPLPHWVMSILKDINFDTKKIVQNQKQEKLGFWFLQKIGETWNFFENNLKFTEISLGFDTKTFGSFAFVQCHQNREIKLCSNMPLLDNLQVTERGVILVYLWLKGQNWYLWIEAVSISRISSVRELLQNNGLLFIEQTYEYEIENQNYNERRLSRRLSKKDVMLRKTIDLYENIQFKMEMNGEIEIYEKPIDKINSVINKTTDNNEKENERDILDLDDFDNIGKRKVSFLDPANATDVTVFPVLSYHSNSYKSNAIIVPIKPIEREKKEWTKIILERISKRSILDSENSTKKQVIKIPINTEILSDIDTSLIEPSMEDTFNISKLSKEEKEFNSQCEITFDVINSPTDLIIIPQQKFKFFIPLEAMKEYFKVLTVEEINELNLKQIKQENEQEMMKNQLEQNELITNDSNKPRSVNYSRIEILSNPRTQLKRIVKEPKIISTKSMLALSSVIRQGLTLAVYLSLPENVIAGIGFDSFTQMSMNGVNSTTYKVFVTWKKMILLNKVSEEIYVEQLMDALKMLNYENIAMMIYDHWKNNKEITTVDCQSCLLKKDSL